MCVCVLTVVCEPGRVVPAQATTADKGSRSTAAIMCNLGTILRWSAYALVVLHVLRNEPRYPFSTRLRKPQGWSGCFCEKSLTAAGFEPQIVRPVA